MGALLYASSLIGGALTLVVLAVTAFVLGRLLTGKLDRPVERWAIPAALGLGVLAHLGFVLGLAGLLRPAAVGVVIAGVHVLGYALRGLTPWPPLQRSWRGGNKKKGPGFVLFSPSPAPLERGPGGEASKGIPRPLHLLLWITALLPLALLTLYPPTAFDATLYHLPFARGFAASGGLPFLADLRFPVFPQANEMLFAMVLLFAPDIAVQGVPWLMTMLTAALLWSWARDSFSSAAGWLAAALYLGNPIVVYLAAVGYVDAGLALFVTSALYAVRRWRGSGERRWLVLAAVFAATAADTKYLGLFFVGVIGLVVLLGRLPERGLRARWTGALLFAVAAALVLAPWYGRIYAWTGNPLFPYFPQVFGSSSWDPIRFKGFLTPHLSLVSRGIDLVRLPWDLVFERGRYNGQPPYSPLYLALLPLALVAAWKDPRPRRLLALAAAYAFVCLALPRDARYMIPALPLVSLAAAGSLAALLGRSPRRSAPLTAALCFVCFLPGWLYVLYRFHHLGPLPLTPAGREAYLARRQPCYPAVAYLNRTLGSGYTVWAVQAENMTYYVRGRLLGDWFGPASFDRVLSNLQGSQDLHGRLRRLDVDHLLIPNDADLLPFPPDAAWRSWFQPVYEDRGARVFKLK